MRELGAAATKMVAYTWPPGARETTRKTASAAAFNAPLNNAQRALMVVWGPIGFSHRYPSNGLLFL